MLLVNDSVSAKKPSHSSRAIPAAICLSTLLKEPVARSSFARADGIKLSIPLISPAQTQQSILVILAAYEVNQRKVTEAQCWVVY